MSVKLALLKFPEDMKNSGREVGHLLTDIIETVDKGRTRLLHYGLSKPIDNKAKQFYKKKAEKEKKRKEKRDAKLKKRYEELKPE